MKDRRFLGGFLKLLGGSIYHKVRLVIRGSGGTRGMLKYKKKREYFRNLLLSDSFFQYCLILSNNRCLTKYPLIAHTVYPVPSIIIIIIFNISRLNTYLWTPHMPIYPFAHVPTLYPFTHPCTHVPPIYPIT